MSALEDELVGLRAQLERFSLRVSERAVVTGRVVRFIGIFGILSRICFDGSPCYVITLIGAVRATIGGGGLDCSRATPEFVSSVRGCSHGSHRNPLGLSSYQVLVFSSKALLLRDTSADWKG